MAYSLSLTDHLLREIASQATAFACDATSNESIQAAFKRIREVYPSHKLKAAVFDAGSPFIVKPSTYELVSI